MMVSDTSIDAYYADFDRLVSIKEQVFEIIGEARHPSSRDIARFLNVERTTITGRIKELKDEGRITEGGKKRDPWTNHMVSWYQYTKDVRA